MLRPQKVASSMQKTYDECYLICSTAIFFEGQNNEAEALRSWRSALDRIYYHNAYRMPQDYRPRSETDCQLQESLRKMELTCKERIAVLEALRESRAEAASKDGGAAAAGAAAINFSGHGSPAPDPGWLGNGTIPPIDSRDLARPPLPSRPAPPPRPSTDSAGGGPARRWDAPPLDVQKPLSPNPPPAAHRSSRSPSPEKKGRMRTTLRPGRAPKKPAAKSGPSRPPAASKAADLAWDTKPRMPSPSMPGHTSEPGNHSGSAHGKEVLRESDDLRRASAEYGRREPPRQGQASELPTRPRMNEQNLYLSAPRQEGGRPTSPRTTSFEPGSPMPPYSKPPADLLRYRKEYPDPKPVSKARIAAAVNPIRSGDASTPTYEDETSPSGAGQSPARRRPVAKAKPSGKSGRGVSGSSESAEETTSSRDASQQGLAVKRGDRKKKRPSAARRSKPTPESSDQEPEGSLESENWEERLAYAKKHLPKGVDPAAAKQIFNEIVVQGDEVHWSDVAGLEAAKKALKEAVVYPFLRPDLFMGLREPARGMLLFGPPGTGKTMLARAVATESRATFFAISASSLTSKWLGDSEKLVRALFQLARALAPSIIFVDEIDSLLSARGGSSEHESTRRIKTEFLIQWSDLQRAAAGREASDRHEGDATRVLVLAATNMPWAIDDAARRRFVRRQYIPLPEREVRAEQLLNLMGHQKHCLDKEDLEVLVLLTEGYSGSDITALAKDAAMGPLRSLGEALLSMSRDEIRPISFADFEASLVNIRPSVNQAGLKEFEDWSRDFGERGA